METLTAFRRFKPFAAFAVALVYVQMVLGSTVRATGSGEGCPDWPLCHGHWYPNFDMYSILEYAHRATAALVTFVCIAAIAWIAANPYLRRELGRLAAGIGTLLGIIITFGALTVFYDMPPAVVACHLVLAATLLMIWLTVYQRTAALAKEQAPEAPAPGWYLYVAPIAMAAIYVQLFLGALVSVSHAGYACPDFPTCYGMWLPPIVGNVGVQVIHRFGAYTVATCVLALIGLAEWQASARVRRLARVAALLVVVQIALGITTVLLQVPPLLSVTHLANGMLLFSTLYLTLYACAPVLWTSRKPVEGPMLPLKVRLNAYYKLTKPAIVMLVVLTGLPAILIATGGHPDLVMTIAALVGTSLAAGSSAVFNQYFERERDKVMRRTAARPIPAGIVSPDAARTFGIVLGVLAMIVLLVWTTPLAALIALGGLLFYGFFYTLVLKPASPQNIVVGGAAGASAPLICWAAATGTVGLPAWIMFAIIFLWTPPHFWALAIFRLEDYVAANIPMYPVVYGVSKTARWIVIYTLMMVPLTLLLVPLHAAGPIYLFSAIALGLGFLALAGAVLRTESKAAATKLFAYSIVYTLALFTALTIDAALGGPHMVPFMAASLR
ncbi:MAG TPA: heme o synthase [Oscillatoriaceae cyanobacterium]